MKKLLIPAVLLLLVGVTAYGAARSVPCCPPTPNCPWSDERCFAKTRAAGSSDCKECCEEPADRASCKEKRGCPGCPKTQGEKPWSSSGGSSDDLQNPDLQLQTMHEGA